ncbi:MAG: hypothetical protein AAFY34_01700 [Pseudomonadota bacterium]
MTATRLSGNVMVLGGIFATDHGPGRGGTGGNLILNSDQSTLESGGSA